VYSRPASGIFLFPSRVLGSFFLIFVESFELGRNSQPYYDLVGYSPSFRANPVRIFVPYLVFFCFRAGRRRFLYNFLGSDVVRAVG